MTEARKRAQEETGTEAVPGTREPERWPVWQASVCRGPKGGLVNWTCSRICSGTRRFQTGGQLGNVASDAGATVLALETSWKLFANAKLGSKELSPQKGDKRAQG